MDIDIDIAKEFNPTKLFPMAIRGSLVEQGELKPHPVGYFFQHMPVDKIISTPLCAALKSKGALVISPEGILITDKPKSKVKNSRLCKSNGEDKK